MSAEFIVAAVVAAPDGGVLERAVPSLDLAVRPWVTGLGQAVLDVALGTGEFEAMRPTTFLPASWPDGSSVEPLFAQPSSSGCR